MRKSATRARYFGNLGLLPCHTWLMLMDSAAAKQTGIAFESMLLAPLLRPLLSKADVFGDYGLELLAEQIARSDTQGFAAIVVARFEGRS